jgi:hypothetical protein
MSRTSVFRGAHGNSLTILVERSASSCRHPSRGEPRLGPVSSTLPS